MSQTVNLGHVKGDKGDTGIQGPQGVQGIQGPAGPAGPGVPTGGTAGQYLKKVSGDNYDTAWENLANATSSAAGLMSAADKVMLDSTIPADLGVVEATDTATHNITSGQYVIWKGVLKKANTNIAIGTTLSSSNLDAVSNGIANELQGNINTLNSKITTRTLEQISTDAGLNVSSFQCYKCGLLVMISFVFTATRDFNSYEVLASGLPNAFTDNSLYDFYATSSGQTNLCKLYIQYNTIATRDPINTGDIVFGAITYMSNE